jgi:hypothetical protein
MDTDTLRKECLKLLIDRGFDKVPRYKLSFMISPDNPENPQALSMALTGYRSTMASKKILERLYSFLTDAYNKKACNF